jgi:glycosyltransferase involved in cell wall biosynthesis
VRVTEPLVSVCVPVRNHGRFLGEAIESVLAQDVDGLELLVHDDASDDDSAQVASAFTGDRRVRYRRHPRPRGVADNRNSLLQAARGRYVAWLDADDAYLPGALARQLGTLERHPSVALVHGATEIVDERGAALPAWRRPFACDTVEPSAKAFRELILSNELTTSTVVARRSAHRLAGAFVAVGASSSDWDMWLRLALRGDVAYSSRPVARYRQHPASISRASTTTGTRLRCDIRVTHRVLRAERPRLHDPRALGQRASAALAAKALLHAGDLQTRGERVGAARAVALAGGLRAGVVGDLVPGLLLATARGDDYRCYRTTKTLLGRLAQRLAGTRFGDSLAQAAATDPDWTAAVIRMAHTVRRVTGADAVVGTVTKWDPTLLYLSGRAGRQFPDRAQLPHGYPPDSATAVAHLERLRTEGLSHLVFPAASLWWLDHYQGLAQRLREPGPPLHADDDCVIFDLRAL